ncbi:hypothetical protein N2601_31145 (plasmid) [Rhizobium sp. CB3060]|uniref:hypothetical protein n=1 Tax=Rhizobium sp. CB3060 TaxID=3138255 RepID=UPI0021A503CC|nr:hypothetical protein [Rhizobium tropici]UWU25446.1 hypothetical protein N2601_31145 [Rhizobium tropici]
MANTAVLQAREIASKKMDTLRAAVKISDDRAKAAAERVKQQDARPTPSAKG